MPGPSQPLLVLFPYSEVRTPGYQHTRAGPRVHRSTCVTWGGGVTPAAAGPTLCLLAAPRSPREHEGFRPAKLTPPSSSAGLLAGEAEPARGPPSQPRPVHQGARLADCSRCLPRLRRLLPRVIAALRTGLAQPSKTDCALTPRVQMSVDAVAGTVSCSPVGLGGPGGPERLLLGTRVR